MSTHGHFGHERTINGKNEHNQSCRVVLRSDGSAIGHVWLTNGDCVAFHITDGGPAFVHASRLRKDAWEGVLRKAQTVDREEDQ